MVWKSIKYSNTSLYKYEYSMYKKTLKKHET